MNFLNIGLIVTPEVFIPGEKVRGTEVAECHEL